MKTTVSTLDWCPSFVWRFQHGESHGLMDLNYADVKLNLSEFILKGRREGAQLVVGSEPELHI